MHGAPAIEGRDGAPALAPKSFPGAPGRPERGGRTPYVRRPTIERRNGVPAPAPKSFPGAPGSGERGGAVYGGT